MQDELKLSDSADLRIDTKVLRHMMLETLDLLDVSTDHADEACSSTDAAMALTRIDWMLMAVFNWLTQQLRTDTDTGPRETAPLGKAVSIVGIDQSELSEGLLKYAETVDRLHARALQLESLIAATKETRAKTPPQQTSQGQVLNIFGDPSPDAGATNAVLESRQRLNCAFGGT